MQACRLSGKCREHEHHRFGSVQNENLCIYWHPATFERNAVLRGTVRWIEAELAKIREKGTRPMFKKNTIVAFVGRHRFAGVAGILAIRKKWVKTRFPCRPSEAS